MASASEISDAINREYDKDPKGWRIYVGPDQQGQLTVYAFHQDVYWTIKYPQFGMNGVGDRGKIEESKFIEELASDPESSGLRMITSHLFQLYLRRGEKEMIKPVSGKDICKELRHKKSVSILRGPILTSNRLAPIIPSQNDLEARLDRQLRHLTDGMYV